MTAIIIDKPTGKPIKINTRVVKPSQEKSSIKMLNVKGRIQTNRLKLIMKSYEINSAKTVNGAKYSGLSQGTASSP